MQSKTVSNGTESNVQLKNNYTGINRNLFSAYRYLNVLFNNCGCVVNHLLDLFYLLLGLNLCFNLDDFSARRKTIT